MTRSDAVVAVFGDHQQAEAAIHKLSASGFDMRQFSIVGKGYHTEETAIGFYNTGDRVKFWGQNGAIWGGLWGLFFGGVLMTVPMVGPVLVLGHFAAMVFAAIEGAVIVGGLGALGGALFSIGIPKDSVILYEQALKADGFLIVAHGPVEDMARAKTMLAGLDPIRVDLHQDAKPMAPLPADHAGHGVAA